MKISTDSWHYKMLTEEFMFMSGKSSYSVSNSLCIYFWQVVMRFLYGVGAGFVYASPFVFPTLLFTGIPFERESLLYFITGLWVGLGFLISALVAMALVVMVLKYLWGKLRSSVSGVKAPKQVNIATAYIKAKKDKVCPMLEFVDD